MSGICDLILSKAGFIQQVTLMVLVGSAFLSITSLEVVNFGTWDNTLRHVEKGQK
jgi:hypothetical protein